MNNQNESDKESESDPGSEANWAEFIEQQGQTLKPDSQPAVPSPLDDLDPQKLNDLQLDGQLRMLRRLSAPDDSFVDDVIARTGAGATQDTTSKSRLPVIAPVFESPTHDVKPQTVAKAATPERQPDESNLPAVTERKISASKVIGILVSIAAAVAVAFLIWGRGEDQSNPSPLNQNFANSGKTKASDESVAPLNERLVDNASPDMESTPRETENLLDSQNNRLNPPKSLVENPLNQPPKLIDNKKDRQLADQPPRGGVRIVSDDPTPRLKWHLAIDFAQNGLGSISLNDTPIKGSLLVDNADFVLRQLGDELTRRAKFLENRLGTEISASISVGPTEFAFNSINEIEQTIEQASQHFATLESSNLSFVQLAELRKSIRQLMLENPTAISSIDLNNQQTAFLTEDEAFTICSILTASESALQNAAKQRVAWEQRTEHQAPKNGLADNSITAKAFTNFVSNGLLVLPKTKSTMVSTIQELGEQELKEALYTSVGSFDLFNDLKEFRDAERNIAMEAQDFQKQVAKKLKSITKADPKDRQKLTAEIIAKIDRTDLESKKFTLAKVPDAQLPLVMGDDCRSNKTEAAAIDRVSSTLGMAVNQFDPSLGSRDPSNNDAFRIRELKKQFKIAIDDISDPQRLKTSDQILQIDHPRMRLELIEALEKSKTETAMQLLAKRAKFDLVPEVRLAATKALARFPHNQYRDELLAGLKYPWHVAAQHSAEALVRLEDEGAVPELVAMLDLPHPKAPVEVNKNKFVRSELVAINHMRNCLLCHAPAASSHELATGVVPSWGKPLPKQYYKSENPHLPSVRADVTYLEQDFSVVQPVWNSGPWPRDQRFDYVVQQKPVKGSKAKQLNKLFADAPNQNREAIVYALQNLTNEHPADNSSASWNAILKRRSEKIAP